MGLFVYKCNVCGRTDEQFRKTEDRESQELCGNIDLSQADFTEDAMMPEDAVCPGAMIFQPINKTNFTMHHLND